MGLCIAKILELESMGFEYDVYHTHLEQFGELNRRLFETCMGLDYQNAKLASLLYVDAFHVSLDDGRKIHVHPTTLDKSPNV